jgi:hypothetical protein
MTDSHKMKERIASARDAIMEAERTLAAAISEIEGARRAEKRHVGEPLGLALERLRVAKGELASLEDLIGD